MMFVLTIIPHFGLMASVHTSMPYLNTPLGVRLLPKRRVISIFTLLLCFDSICHIPTFFVCDTFQSYSW